MVGEPAPEVFRDMAGDDSSHCGWNADGPKLSSVGWILVEEEKVRVGEESVDVLRDMILENKVEELLEGRIGGGIVSFGEVNEGVD